MTEKFAGENELKVILAKEPQALNEYELEVLRARIGYLSDAEKEKFGLNVAVAAEKEVLPVAAPAIEEKPKAEPKKKVEIKKPLKGNKKFKK